MGEGEGEGDGDGDDDDDDDDDSDGDADDDDDDGDSDVDDDNIVNDDDDDDNDDVDDADDADDDDDYHEDSDDKDDDAGTVSQVRPILPPKRLGGVLSSPLAGKRPRLPGFMSNLSGALNPATLDPVNRLCRICGQESSVIFSLKGKPEMVTWARRILNINLDLEAEKEAGYPAVICRKCCNLLETFANFRKLVNQGQELLTKRVEAARQSKQARENTVEMVEEVMLPDSDSPESIGVDPLDSGLPESDTILPDSEDITVKHEKIGGSSELPEVAPVSCISTSVTSVITAPMTAVFADAARDLNIKAEPGLVTIKKEDTFEITPMASMTDDSKVLKEAEKEVEQSSEKREEGKTSVSDNFEKENAESRLKTFSDVLDDISSGETSSSPKGEKSKSEVTNQREEPPEPESDDTGYEDQSDLNTEMSDEVNGGASEEKKEGENEAATAGEEIPAEDTTEDTTEDTAGAGEEVNGVQTSDEDFGDLFCDYPGMEESWQEVTNSEALDLGPIDIQGNFEDWMGDEDECLEDAPGMEVRDLREQSEGSLDDPLFGTEEEGDLGELDPVMGEVSEEVSERPGALDISDESGLSDRTYGEDEGDEAGDNLNEDCDEGLQTDQQQASDNLESENFD